MILLAGEVALALHGAVVFALGLVQDDSYPLPGREGRGADEGDRAALSFPNHLHHGAHLHRPAAPVRTHPAAATAGRLEGEKTHRELNKTKNVH